VIVGVFGVPAPATSRGAQVVRAIVAEVYGSCELMTVRTVEEAAGYLSEGKLPNAVIFNEYPDPPLIKLLAEARVPIILFLDSFASTVGALMRGSGLPHTGAMRTATICFSAIDEAIAHAPLIVRSDIRKNPVEALIGPVARFLNVAVTHGQSQRVSQAIAAETGVPEIHNLEDFPPPPDGAGFEPEEQDPPGYSDQLAACYLCYDAVLGGQPIRKAIWPASVFLAADQSGASADQDFDLTGPARFLIYGPYFGLPRGIWLARPVFLLQENFSSNSMTIDVAGSGELLAIGRSDLPCSGRFTTEIQFEVRKPSTTLEIRFQLMQGAIEGKFRLDHISFERL
jgi:hypothetical protein